MYINHYITNSQRKTRTDGQSIDELKAWASFMLLIFPVLISTFESLHIIDIRSATQMYVMAMFIQVGVYSCYNKFCVFPVHEIEGRE